jgi:hypothetical protein
MSFQNKRQLKTMSNLFWKRVASGMRWPEAGSPQSVFQVTNREFILNVSCNEIFLSKKITFLILSISILSAIFKLKANLNFKLSIFMQCAVEVTVYTV